MKRVDSVAELLFEVRDNRAFALPGTLGVHVAVAIVAVGVVIAAIVGAEEPHDPIVAFCVIHRQVGERVMMLVLVGILVFSAFIMLILRWLGLGLLVVEA